jgi:peptidoglycan/LPS O-acetylase OafA/YrhL
MARQSFYASLEILRGLCALEVFLSHCASRMRLSYVETSSALTFIYESLYRGSAIAVIGFFVVSGFVTTLSFYAYLTRYPFRQAALVFYGARVLRICAVAIPATVIPFLMVLAYRSITGDWRAWNIGGYNDFSAAAVIQSALGWSAEWNPAQWTLRYELVFYAALPFLFVAMFRRSMTGYLGLAYCVGVIALMANQGALVPHILTPFLLGMAAFAVIGRVKVSALLLLPSVIGILLACAIGERYGLLSYASVAVGVLALASNDERIPRVPALLGLGACSYSLYLWHWPVLWMGTSFLLGSRSATSGAQILKVYAVTIPAVALVTWLSWYFIERHARMRNVLAHLGTRTTLPSAA